MYLKSDQRLSVSEKHESNHTGADQRSTQLCDMALMETKRRCWRKRVRRGLASIVVLLGIFLASSHFELRDSSPTYDFCRLVSGQWIFIPWTCLVSPILHVISAHNQTTSHLRKCYPSLVLKLSFAVFPSYPYVFYREVGKRENSLNLNSPRTSWLKKNFAAIHLSYLLPRILAAVKKLFCNF